MSELGDRQAEIIDSIRACGPRHTSMHSSPCVRGHRTRS